jgi:hypothetical protein
MEPKVFLDELREPATPPDVVTVKKKIDDIYRNNDIPGEVVRLSRTVDNALATLRSFHTLAEQMPTIAISPTKITVEPEKSTVVWKNYPTTFRDKYLFIKGRHRLGTMRNSAALALVWLPITLGLWWVVWLKKGFQELLWHSFGRFDYDKFLPPLGLSLIFGAHFLYVKRLALLLSHAEKQNGYTKTSPRLAIALAVVPPFAAVYLQRRLNDHWRLHVTNHEFVVVKEGSVP